jgi:acetyl-CoA carboxylase carboxyl transferase subunit alpha
MLENTWYSVISPESCSSILWRSWDYKENAANALKLTGKDMLKNKLIDGIIKEPLGGAHAEPEKMYKKLKAEIKSQISELELLSSKERIVKRTEKFSNMGN